MSHVTEGIAKATTALSRWALLFNLKSQISADTKKLFGVDFYDPELIWKLDTVYNMTESNKKMWTEH